MCCRQSKEGTVCIPTRWHARIQDGYSSTSVLHWASVQVGDDLPGSQTSVGVCEELLYYWSVVQWVLAVTLLWMKCIRIWSYTVKNGVLISILGKIVPKWHFGAKIACHFLTVGGAAVFGGAWNFRGGFCMRWKVTFLFSSIVTLTCSSLVCDRLAQ